MTRMRVRMAGSAPVVVVLLALATWSCRSADHGSTPTEDATAATVAPPETPDAAEEDEQRRLALRAEREKERAAYVALPPTAQAGPASSVFGFKKCPPNYALARADAGGGLNAAVLTPGDYCGKLCQAPPCDGDASATCCGSHRCDHRSINQIPWQHPDGPMPAVCSAHERKSR